MYQLVNKIEEYPKFLNWCSDSTILKQNDEQIIASMMVSKGFFNKSFTTVNKLTPNKKIDIELEDGPFSYLKGFWIFKPLNEKSSEIEFQLEFDFSSKLLTKTISPIFTYIGNSQLDAFIARAKEIYQ
jgi:ribosome-associated toxin RatA of RatAB toxin-antitoxin module